MTQLCFLPLFYRLHRELNPKVAYSCMNDSQEERDPARIFSVALLVESLSPALETG